MTELQPPQQIDWANDAYVALNNQNMLHQHLEKWPSMQNPGFSIPPSLLTRASIERYGQVTPPEENSPANLPPSAEAREGSIPVEQLRNETIWPQQQQQEQQQTQSQLQASQEPASKRRRTSRQTTSSSSQVNNGTPPSQDANPQPPKRKRGRPKSQPQMVEAYTADGFPFQVSSARQSHLEKNRVAAHKCRQRKKEYINGLEDRARQFSAKNKALKENVAMLREEVLGLKNEVLRHAGCGFWAVDEYLARCAGDLLGMEAPREQYPSDAGNAMQSNQFMNDRHNNSDSIPTQQTDVSSPDDDFGGLELLRDFDDEDMDELERLV